MVISLKKYLDMDPAKPSLSEPAPSEVLQASLDCYRSALRSMGEAGARACPAVGSKLQESLTALADRLGSGVTPAALAENSSRAGEQLQQWGDRTSEYFAAKTGEVKELLLVLARTAESVGERDHQYAGHLSQFTTRLRSICSLEDLTQVRASLVQQASDLKIYVDQMERDSHSLTQKLQAKVSTYETKLKKVEELAWRDALTKLANRRSVEERIEEAITRGQAFCVVLLDLNRLKQINDQHGHLAGDSVLQQFAQELRSSSRPADLAGRWGGDEFLIVMEGDAAAANTQIARLRKWVFGKYTIPPGKGSGEIVVVVDAAVGLAQWQPGETMKTVIARADADMYAQKEKARRAGAR